MMHTYDGEISNGCVGVKSSFRGNLAGIGSIGVEIHVP